VGSKLVAFDGPIELRRVCLDANDSSIVLYFNKLNDNCATFTKIEVFGRVVKSSPDNFSLVYSTTTLPSTGQIGFKQPNLKEWEYYIQYSFKCDGSSVLLSDTLKIDFTSPDFIELDSVSVDAVSQKTIIGWPKNTSIDHEGYRVFETINANNVQVADQTIEGYIHPSSQPTLKPTSYTYNSYDSCSNFNILASNHSTIFLSRRFSFCDLTISLNWTAYVGWITDKYYIYASTNGSAFAIIDSTSSLNYLFKNVQKGANYCFFIRSKKAGSTFTSSSNRICLTFPNYPTVQNTHIKSISVIDENTMRIKWSTEKADVAVNAALYRGETLTSMQFIKNIPFANGDNYVLDNVDTEKSSYLYRVIVRDSCLQNHDSSTILESVFLSKNENTSNLEWSSFNFDQSIHVNDNIYTDGSTWNLISSMGKSPNQTFTISPDSAFCYRIISISNTGDSSISNKICVFDELRIFIPNAIKFNGSGTNNVFGVYGTGIDWDKTSIGIFTRWGEKIAVIESGKKTWDGTYKFKRVQSGIYLYSGIVFGLKQEKQAIKGTIIILD